MCSRAEGARNWKVQVTAHASSIPQPILAHARS